MKRFVEWMAAEAAERSAIDRRLELIGGRYVLDTGWVGGRVHVSAEEAAAIRQVFYLLALLPYVTTVPMTGLLVAAILGPASHSIAFRGIAIAVTILLLPALGFLHYPYMAMVARGRPRVESGS